jgi:multidrug efflux pump subunit AcrA (membrane-fusion protein)
MKPTGKYLVVFAVAVIVGIATLFSLFGRKAKASQSADSAVRPAAVALAERRPLSNSLTLSGDFRPFQEVDVHAKISGYISKIYVDVGDHVKAGQTLATLEVPS